MARCAMMRWSSLLRRSKPLHTHRHTTQMKHRPGEVHPTRRCEALFPDLCAVADRVALTAIDPKPWGARRQRSGQRRAEGERGGQERTI